MKLKDKFLKLSIKKDKLKKELSKINKELKVIADKIVNKSSLSEIIKNS